MNATVATAHVSLIACHIPVATLFSVCQVERQACSYLVWVNNIYLKSYYCMSKSFNCCNYERKVASQPNTESRKHSFISSNLIHNSYINYIKLNASTCFEHHPLILRRSMSLIIHVCSLQYSHSLQVAVL